MPPNPSEILDRLPPHDLDAERAVIGSILLDQDRADEVALEVTPDEFYADAHRKLFAHMMTERDAGRRVDVGLLATALRKAGEFEAIGGAAYLAEVLESVPIAAHAAYYAKIVREKALLRSVIHASADNLRDAYDPMADGRETLNKSQERLNSIGGQHAAGNVRSVHDVLLSAFDHLERLLDGNPAIGVPTGINDLNKLTGGLHDGELTILAARPSMGKTALALNIADYVSMESGLTTLFVSLEMSALSLVERMLCSRAGVSGHKFRQGVLSAQDRHELTEASAALSRASLFLDDTPSRSATEIAAITRRLKQKNSLALLIVDYLQLISPDNARDPREQQVAKIARRLKSLARELSIPVLCVAQLNRETEKGGDNRPKLSNLRESGAIEQDADVVMFVHREEYYRPEDKDVRGKAELLVRKQRNGPTGTVSLIWRKECMRFEQAAVQERYSEFEEFS